ncbi:hypothetical protein BLNAU_25188 [Blattamonas nauphoetae]|uniref:Uncharacterized protein n=1 Tax=Blattamonas nauphoetae TaxID=2049346 RepID=A0ABQ9WKQ1_9EUKA|nr:hypothetical protein BLNAU_25188 [Blattamonas nauphoetae]
MHSVLCTTQQQEESTLPSFCLTTSICCSASLSNSFGERRCFSAVVGAHVNCLVVTCASEDVVGGVCRVRSAGDSFRSPHFSCSELFGFGRGRACHQSVGEQVGSAAPLNTQALFLMLQFASGLPPKLVRPRSLLSTHSHSHSRCLFLRLFSFASLLAACLTGQKRRSVSVDNSSKGQISSEHEIACYELETGKLVGTYVKIYALKLYLLS